jgi:uncharacterized membrane protein (DUF4010 family)
MEPEELLRRLGAALAIGLLIGAERHWRERSEAAGQRAAGVRTFAITGLAGGVSGALADSAGGWLLGLAMLAFAASFVPFALREAMAEGSHSATTSVAAFATFALGALAVLGPLPAAAAAAVAVTAILASRDALHGLVARITWPELRAAVLLLSMTFLAAPLIPDEPLGWLGGLNPARIWTLAILLAAISFAGYLAVRLIGAERGLLAAGAAAGLVSSTAATLTHARRARAGGPAVLLAAGTHAASTVSCLRTAVLVWLVQAEVARLLAPALLAAAAGFALAALVLARRGAGEAAIAHEPENPFEFSAVLRLALLLGAVGVAAKAAAARLGTGGVLAVAAITGLADVDAIALSVPPLAPGTIGLPLAAAAVGVAVAVNTLAKATYAVALGGARHGLAVLLPSLAALGAGVAAFAVLA